MSYHQPLQVECFYGCDRSLALKVLHGEEEIKPSDNAWDWLGSGIYFWEYNPLRALTYVQEVAKGTQKNKKKINTPFVLGAIVSLGECLNLVEPEAISMLQKSYDDFKLMCEVANLTLPQNDGPVRKLDCAMVQFLNKIKTELDSKPYDTVRAAFKEGKEIYPGSNFMTHDHIQIAVNNVSNVKGYFLPKPYSKYNPYLNA
jgi:hypothetical protein